VKITYERTGGFAGLTNRAVVETDALGPPEKAALEGLVNSASFFALPAALNMSNPQARDAFQHSIQIEHGGREHTVTIDGAPSPGPLQELVKKLQSFAKR
jgi:hypothetical protein